MSIQYYENIIKEKRRNTSFRDFVKWVGSRMSLCFYRRKVLINGTFTTLTSVTPETSRSKNIVDGKWYLENQKMFTEQAREYDFTKSFFSNFWELLDSVPAPTRFTDDKSVDCDHAASVWMSNKVYLSILAIDDCENILYTFYTQDGVKNTLNSVMVWDHSENIYFSSGVLKSYNVFYSRYITNSANIWFSTNLIGCQECILCDTLTNASYCIRNKQYSQEEYLKEKTNILSNKSDFERFYLGLSKKWENFGSKNIVGKFCIESENVENGFFSYRVSSGRNIFFVWDKDGRRNAYDTICSDQKWEGDVYGCINLGSASNCYLSDSFIWASLYYCYNCLTCSFCIGCTGLTNKSYYILNKQYTKEEWEIQAEKIFASMERDGTLWEFFPGEMSRLYFNDTLASLIYDDFTKEEVEAAWYLWRDEPIRVDIPEGVKIVKNTELDQYQWFDVHGAWKIHPDVMDTVISDAKWNYYRIVQYEYDFLMKHGLPLPTLHWLDRIKLGFRG